MLQLGKFSIGVGDRFAHQARAQLAACIKAEEQGAVIVPVWNKSNREHLIVGSEPSDVRYAADEAVRDLGWHHPYHVDADHIRLETVERFIAPSDFFTIDVADYIGQPASREKIEAFVKHHGELAGTNQIPGIDQPFQLTRNQIQDIGAKYFYAIQKAGQIYRHIEKAKGEGQFIAEVSMDETDGPQTPAELLVLLVALADEKIPLQTIAPKFTGRFNKGVDYAGDLKQFEKELNDDLAIIAFTVKNYELPGNLKLSIHSGSDKFSLYGPIRRALARFKAGVHLKTAGTTWLEELIGLAEAGGEGLALAREVYGQALAHIDELCAPYASVIDIDRSKLPPEKAALNWTSGEFVAALRHDPKNPSFNPHLRQLLHVGYKIAAQMGDRYIKMLKVFALTISRNVTGNLYERHIKPLFMNEFASKESSNNL